MEKRKRQSRRISAICLTDLDFADDIALLSDKIEQSRQLLHNVEVECGKAGLLTNAKKTKAMFLNTNIEDIETADSKKIKQAVIEGTEEQDFKYLGSWVCSKEETSVSVKHLLGKL